MPTDEPTARAADLAERILDEVSRAQQDWGTIERGARELAELAARAGGEVVTAPQRERSAPTPERRGRPRS